jgi:hypothetical protein
MEALLRYLHPESPEGPGTIGNVLENILRVRIIKEVSGCRLLRDEQFGFRAKHSTSLQQARLFERGSGNTGEKRHTGALFLDVDKAFHIIRDDGLTYKLTVLNLLSYLVKSISSYLRDRTLRLHSKQLLPLAVVCGLAWRRED